LAVGVPRIQVEHELVALPAGVLAGYALRATRRGARLPAGPAQRCLVSGIGLVDRPGRLPGPAAKCAGLDAVPAAALIVLVGERGPTGHGELVELDEDRVAHRVADEEERGQRAQHDQRDPGEQQGRRAYHPALDDLVDPPGAGHSRAWRARAGAARATA